MSVENLEFLSFLKKAKLVANEKIFEQAVFGSDVFRWILIQEERKF